MFKRKHLDQLLLCSILITLPLERIPSLRVHGSNVRLSQVLGVVLIGLMLPRLWQRRGDWVRSPWIWLGLFNLSSLVSAALSHHHSHGLKTALFILFVSVLAYTISVIFERRWLRQYAIAALIGVVGSCVFGMYQFFGDLAGLPGWLTGLRAEYMKGGLFAFPRIQSTGLEPLYFSNYLLVPLALLSGFQVFAQKRRVWMVTLLVLTVITLGLSRGAQVAAALIVVAVVLVAGWKRHYRPAAGLALTGVGAVALSLALIGLATLLYNHNGGGSITATGNIKAFAQHDANLSQGESAQGRTLTRQLAINAIKAHPAFGLGSGNFGFYANQQDPAKFPTTTAIVNNETLEVAAEQGLIGLALLGLFILTLAQSVYRSLRRERDPLVRLITFGITLGLIGVGIQYQLFSTLYITHIWVAIGFLAGATTAAAATTKTPASLKARRT